MSKNHSLKAFKDNFMLITIIVISLIVGLWLITYFMLKDYPATDRGTFGDMFGSINALYSGLALAGIMLSILLQRSEIKLQSEELKETRREFQTQNETLKIQRFENIFFNLLTQYHTIVNSTVENYYKPRENSHSITQDYEMVVINGSDAFTFHFKQMYLDLQKNEDNYEEIFNKHYNIFENDLGHYFRTLYRIIKIVDEADFFYEKSKTNETEIFKIKYMYVSILRSQVSDYELAWIFYNCLTEKGSGKFKDLIEKYSFLKNIRPELIAFDSHRKLLNQSAFITISEN
jgi:hypothetical protein